jgi:hypothetical protein
VLTQHCRAALLHLGARRVIYECPGCGVRHREFWDFRSVGSFDLLHRVVVWVLAKLGVKNVKRFALTSIPLFWLFLLMRALLENRSWSWQNKSFVVVLS